MRIVKTAVLLLLLLSVTLFAARFLLLDRLTTIALQKAGADDITVHFSSIDLNQAHIDVLAATFTLPSGKNLPVTLHNISLYYTLPLLLTMGRCDRITVKTMDISRAGTSENAGKPVHMPKQVTMLSNRLRSRLPVNNFSIQHLLFHNDLPAQLTDKVIGLHADIKGTAIRATINLQADADTQITAELTSPDAEHLTADIVGHRNNAQIIQARLAVQPDTWSGTLSLQLQPVRDILLQITDLSALPGLEGRLDGNVTLPFPLQDNSKIKAEIHLHDNKTHHILLQASGNPGTQILNLSLSGRDKDQEFINTNLLLQQQHLTGSYSLQSREFVHFIAPYLKQQLPEISGSLKGKLNIPLPGTKDHSFNATVLADSPALPGVSASTVQVRATGEIDGSGIQLAPESQFECKGLVAGNNRVEHITLGLAGNFRLLAEQLHLNFTEKQNLQIKGLTAGEMHIADLNIQTEKPLQIYRLNKQNSWTINTNTLHVSPLLIVHGKRTCSTGPLTFRFPGLNNLPANLELTTAISTPAAVLTNNKLELPLKNVTGTLQLARDRINGKLQFSPAVIPGRVRAGFIHNPATGAGSFTLATDRRFDLDQEGISLADLLHVWQRPYNLDSGKVSFKVNGSWARKRKMHLSAFVAVTGGNGFYKHFLFKGLALRQDLAVLPRLRSKSVGNFSLQQLIGGIDFHAIEAGVNFLPTATGSLPQIRMNDFNSSVFKGIISCPDIVYDLNLPDSNFLVRINKIDLESVFKLLKMDNLSVTGRISGTIPVTIQGKNISVVNGELYNEPPGGHIRYTPADMNQSGVTGYAMKAVEDFRYTSLKTTARYAADGQLDLDIRLQGTSPKLSTSRPVHLNIHAEQNLPALMQSLRFSKGLTEELDKRLKQHYK